MSRVPLSSPEQRRGSGQAGHPQAATACLERVNLRRLSDKITRRNSFSLLPPIPCMLLAFFKLKNMLRKH